MLPAKEKIDKRNESTKGHNSINRPRIYNLWFCVFSKSDYFIALVDNKKEELTQSSLLSDYFRLKWPVRETRKLAAMIKVNHKENSRSNQSRDTIVSTIQ